LGQEEVEEVVDDPRLLSRLLGDLWRDGVHTFAPLRSRASEDDAADQAGIFQYNLSGDEGQSEKASKSTCLRPSAPMNGDIFCHG